MDDKLKLKLVENRRRVEEEYRKNRVRCRPDILRQKADPAAAVNKELDLKLKLMENRRRVQEEYMKNRCADILRRQKSGPAGDKFTSKPIPKPAGNKRKAPEHAHAPARKKLDDRIWNHFFDRAYAPHPSRSRPRPRPRPIMEHYVFLFELALGYALFDTRDMNLHPGVVTTFKISEKYLNNNPFTLRAFYPFPSPGDALVQMKAICTSTVTKELKSFIADNIPEPSSGYVLGVSTPRLAETMCSAARKNCISGQLTDHVMRALRVKIDKLIVGLKPGDLKRAQLNLARSYHRQGGYHRQSRVCKESSNVQRIFQNVNVHKVMVEPHKFEGLYITKGLGKKNFICTKNLVPGKVLYGDQLISVKNEDDRTEVEYRVWNPHVSKLAAAVVSGVANIWVKPGSHVLYLGDVCGITVLQLSDLVGSDGLVYVIGLSVAVANTVGERSNVVTLPENHIFRKDYSVIPNRDYRVDCGMDYRMVIGMVDVILGDIVCPDFSSQVPYIISYAGLHLKSGGHYLISIPPKNMNLSSQLKDLFADEQHLPFDTRMEFKTNQLVMLEAIGRGHAMVVGSYRTG